jgi:hypothetical protein
MHIQVECIKISLILVVRTHVMSQNFPVLDCKLTLYHQIQWYSELLICTIEVLCDIIGGGKVNLHG